MKQKRADIDLKERVSGGLLSLACGDALANGVEFLSRDSYSVEGMSSTRRFLPVGQWSDDTGLALCLAESLIDKKGFDAHDQMMRYEAFYEHRSGWPCELKLVPGNTIASSLRKFRATGEPFSGPSHSLSAGNGGLMRLLPVIIAAQGDIKRVREWSRESTRTTHGASECLEASELLGLIINALLSGLDKDHALGICENEDWKSGKINLIAQKNYLSKTAPLIKTTGYVVDTLEAALWCFATAESLEEAVLKAANLGGDCDTIAAVSGQLAGSYYGKGAIPSSWLDVLVQRERIVSLAHELLGIRSGKTFEDGV